MVEIFFIFYFLFFMVCVMRKEAGGRERKEKVGGGLRWPERQWSSEWVVMGRANYKKKYYTCHIFIFWVVVELATGRASDRLPKR